MRRECDDAKEKNKRFFAFRQSPVQANSVGLNRTGNGPVPGDPNRTAATRGCLIRRLYCLSDQIEAIKSQIQVRFALSLFITQSMTVSQREMDNQRLNNVEIEVIDSAEVPRPAAGERVLTRS